MEDFFNEQLDRQMGKRSRFSAYEGAFVFIIAIVANFVVQGFAGVIVGLLTFIEIGTGGEGQLDNAVVILQYIFMIIIQISFALTYYFLIIKKKQKLLYAPVIHKSTNSRLALLLCPLLAVASLLAFYPVAILFSVVLEKIGYESMSFLQLNSPIEHILVVIAVVLLAPVFEELIFRGALLSGLNRKLCIHKSVLLSALLFMLMHMNPEQTAYQFLLGVVMGYAAVFTKTVLAPIIIHAVSNLLAYLLEATAMGNAANDFIEALADSGFGVLAGIGFFVVFSAAILGILLLLRKLTKEVKDVEEEFEDEPLSTLKTKNKRNYKTLVKIGAVLCFIMWIFTLFIGCNADLLEEIEGKTDQSFNVLSVTSIVSVVE